MPAVARRGVPRLRPALARSNTTVSRLPSESILSAGQEDQAISRLHEFSLDILTDTASPRVHRFAGLSPRTIVSPIQAIHTAGTRIETLKVTSNKPQCAGNGASGYQYLTAAAQEVEGEKYVVDSKREG